MAPSLYSSSWLSKDTRKGTSVVVTMEKPKYTVLQINVPDAEDFKSVDKGRLKNAKQFTWVLLLRVHRAAGCVAWLAATAWAVPAVIKKRLLFQRRAEPEADRLGKGHYLLKFIRVFLALSLLALAFEFIAYWNGWHFQKPNLHLPDNLHIPETMEIQGWLHLAYLYWLSFRADYVAYPIQFLSNICIVLFGVQSVDRIILCLGCFWIKLRKIKPKIKEEPFVSDDGLEYEYPKVLVQIPMCNEREVYQQSIVAACQLDWPKEQMLIQVLDDSDDETIQLLIEWEVSKWSQRGVNIVYRHRVERTGYKAGNLRSAMNCDYVKDYEFVVIFDADFQPNPDFLKLTVPHFKGNPDLGLVQARWSCINKDENLLTRLQIIDLCFHFEVEQQVNGVFFNFFGFNGTAGVWRIKALEDSGGWLDRTTVEDMDLAVRAHLKGWKFIFLNDVKVLCEVPESFEAYRKQQHRWHSGPMHLFRLCFMDIIRSKISLWKKANLILFFFLLRKLILPFYSFTLFCVILPVTMFVPETKLPIWVICYMPIVITVLNILSAPRSFPFIVPYILFSNTMSVTKFNAMMSGILQLGSTYEWVVTKKAGRSSKLDILDSMEEQLKSISLEELHKGVSERELSELSKLSEQKTIASTVKKTNKIYKKELAIALLLLSAAVQSLLSAQGAHFYFLLFQGVSFLLVGLDLIGEQVN